MGGSSSKQPSKQVDTRKPSTKSSTAPLPAGVTKESEPTANPSALMGLLTTGRREVRDTERLEYTAISERYASELSQIPNREQDSKNIKKDEKPTAVQEVKKEASASSSSTATSPVEPEPTANPSALMGLLTSGRREVRDAERLAHDAIKEKYDLELRQISNRVGDKAQKGSKNADKNEKSKVQEDKKSQVSSSSSSTATAIPVKKAASYPEGTCNPKGLMESLMEGRSLIRKQMNNSYSVLSLFSEEIREKLDRLTIASEETSCFSSFHFKPLVSSKFDLSSKNTSSSQEVHSASKTQSSEKGNSSPKKKVDYVLQLRVVEEDEEADRMYKIAAFISNIVDIKQKFVIRLEGISRYLSHMAESASFNSLVKTNVLQVACFNSRQKLLMQMMNGSLSDRVDVTQQLENESRNEIVRSDTSFFEVFRMQQNAVNICSSFSKQLCDSRCILFTEGLCTAESGIRSCLLSTEVHHRALYFVDIIGEAWTDRNCVLLEENVARFHCYASALLNLHGTKIMTATRKNVIERHFIEEMYSRNANELEESASFKGMMQTAFQENEKYDRNVIIASWFKDLLVFVPDHLLVLHYQHFKFIDLQQSVNFHVIVANCQSEEQMLKCLQVERNGRELICDYDLFPCYQRIDLLFSVFNGVHQIYGDEKKHLEACVRFKTEELEIVFRLQINGCENAAFIEIIEQHYAQYVNLPLYNPHPWIPSSKRSVLFGDKIEPIVHINFKKSCKASMTFAPPLRSNNGHSNAVVESVPTQELTEFQDRFYYGALKNASQLQNKLATKYLKPLDIIHRLPAEDVFILTTQQQKQLAEVMDADDLKRSLELPPLKVDQEKLVHRLHDVALNHQLEVSTKLHKKYLKKLK